MIKSNIQGKHITHNYEVKYERDDKGELKYKPSLTVKDTEAYETILIVDGEIGQNSSKFWGFYSTHRINISESESVVVEEKIYRADLHEYMIHTDKVLSEKDVNKEEAEALLSKLSSEYNELMIERDEKLVAYCHVHKLDPEDTDYEELKKIVYKPCDINDTITSLTYAETLSNIAVGTVTISDYLKTSAIMGI